VLSLAQQKEKEGAGIPGGCPSPAKGWAKMSQMAPAHAQSSPPGKQEQGGGSPGEGKVWEQREEICSLKKQREEMNDT
jgi:hypothetical protein